MSAFTSYIGHKIEAKRGEEIIGLLAGITWYETSGSLIFDRIYENVEGPFNVVIDDSITLNNLVITNPGRINTDVTYEFEQQG